MNYVLESLALGGVDETILFCCRDGAKIKEHLRLVYFTDYIIMFRVQKITITEFTSSGMW